MLLQDVPRIRWNGWRGYFLKTRNCPIRVTIVEAIFCHVTIEQAYLLLRHRLTSIPFVTSPLNKHAFCYVTVAKAIFCKILIV